MSVTGKTGIGIPTLLLHEGEGLIVTLELRDGTTVRGMLDSSQDNFNCIMKDAIRTDPMGRTDTVPHLFVRGGEVRMVILPDMLAHAPMFKRVILAKKGIRQVAGTGVGKSNLIASKVAKKAKDRDRRMPFMPPRGPMAGGPGGPPPGPGGPPPFGGPPPMGGPPMGYSGRR